MTDIEAIRARAACAYANGGPHPLADVHVLLNRITELEEEVRCITVCRDCQAFVLSKAPENQS